MLSRLGVSKSVGSGSVWNTSARQRNGYTPINSSRLASARNSARSSGSHSDRRHRNQEDMQPPPSLLDTLLYSRKRSYPLLLISLAATLLSIIIGLLAIAEIAGSRIMGIQGWSWLITSQVLYAGVLWLTCYTCLSASIGRASFHSDAWMHPYTTQLMDYLFQTALQTTFVWVLYSMMNEEDRVWFDNYRYDATKPQGFNINFSIIWYGQMFYLSYAMTRTLSHFSGACKYQSTYLAVACDT